MQLLYRICLSFVLSIIFSFQYLGELLFFFFFIREIATGIRIPNKSNIKLKMLVPLVLVDSFL